MSDERNDGGAAFPSVNSVDADGNMSAVYRGDDGRGTYIESLGGMTLRDYFAGQALAGLCGNSFHLARNAAENVKGEGRTTQNLVEDAYSLADAMLVEREK